MEADACTTRMLLRTMLGATQRCTPRAYPRTIPTSSNTRVVTRCVGAVFPMTDGTCVCCEAGAAIRQTRERRTVGACAPRLHSNMLGVHDDTYCCWQILYLKSTSRAVSELSACAAVIIGLNRHLSLFHAYARKYLPVHVHVVENMKCPLLALLKT